MTSWWLLPGAVMLAGSVFAAISVRRAATEITAADAQLASIDRARASIAALAAVSGSIRSRTDSAGDTVLAPGHR